jgi:hypothetical protein
MAINQAALIQAVYDAIFSAYIQPPVAGLPTNKQQQDFFLTLEWPGQQLDASQYQNPWSPQNPQGQQSATEYFSALVDSIPMLFPVYTDSGITVEEMYQFLLAATPVSTSTSLDVNPVAIAFAKAKSVFERSKLGSLVNPALEYHPSYAMPANWYDETAAKAWTKITINSKQLQIKPDSPFLKLGGVERANSGVWRLPDKVASQLKPQPEIAPTSSPQILNKEILVNVDLLQPRATLNNSSLRELQTEVLGVQQLKPIQPIPMQRFNTLSNQAQPLNVDLLKVQRINTELSRVRRINPELLKKIQVVPTKDNTLDQQTKDLEISFRFCRVTVQRPWLTNSLLKLAGWQIVGQEPGSLSTGSIENNPGSFPMLPIAFIAVRDLEIKAAWGQNDKNIAEMAASGSQPIGFGPFSLSGQYAESGKTYFSRFDGVTISSPGLQILGWINQITPYAPPKG